MKKIGRYDILEELGRGATGVVYKAFDPTIGRVVALKVLSLTPPQATGLPGARESFMREARAAGSLSHPGIVAIHDAMEDPESQSSCIVMEYVAGRTLEKILASEPRFKADRALEIARQVAEALDYAHRQNVIHRDLKPANIILTTDGHAKLTDFGIAKMLAREGAARTVAIMGTPSYMSPEQVSGGEVDARSDLFSLGIVLYLMLTEEKPFKGDTAAVMFKIAYEDPVPPSRLNPALSRTHDYITLRCLAKNRKKRYGSARELLDDLEDVRGGRVPRSEAGFPLAELRVGEPTLVALGTAPKSLAGLPYEARRKPVPIRTALLLGLLIVSLAGLWTSRRRNAPAGPATDRETPNQASSSGVSANSNLLPTVQPTSAEGKELPVVDQHGRPPGLMSEPSGRLPAGGAGAPAISNSGHRTPVAKGPRPAQSTRAKPTPRGGTPGRVVQIICRHDFADAKLTVSSGEKIISEWRLRGRKKRGFLGIKGAYTGALSRSIAIPQHARELTIRVASADGSFDLAKPVSTGPPAGSPATLQIEVSGDRLTVDWQAPPHPKTPRNLGAHL